MSEEKHMLLIGNGFDLANGLPTKYGDFLDFCKMVHWGVCTCANKKLVAFLKPMILQPSDNPDDKIPSKEYLAVCEQLQALLKDNIWFWYFRELYDQALSGENWIDFEKEISLIIFTIDNQDIALDDSIKAWRDDAYTRNFKSKVKREKWEKWISIASGKMQADAFVRDFRKKLLDDLDDLTYALEIYLCDFVEKSPIATIPPALKTIKPNVLVSFNYTHTYNKIYSELDVEKIVHVHGECKKIGKEKSNMVIGIDEYWTDERKDAKTDYAVFKKFVRRIQRCNEVLDIKKFQFYEINPYGTVIISTTLHVFGHSLDVTDKDILQELFQNGIFKKIVIYYVDKPTEGEYIANVIKIIGQEELIKRTKSSSIVFQALN